MADFEPQPHRARVPRVDTPAARAPEFPGATRRHVPRSAIETFEGRLEYWDGDAETMWVAEPTPPTTRGRRAS